MEQGKPLAPPVNLFADARTYIVFGAAFFVLAIMAALFNTSILLPVILVVGVIAVVALFMAPLELLASLVIVRMSLDYSSQYVTFTFFERVFTLSQLLGIAVALLGALFILIHIRSLPRYPLMLPYTLIGVWGAASLLVSISPAATLQELLRVFDLFVIGFIAYVSVERYRDYRFLLTAIFVSSLVPILFGVYQFIFGIGLTDENVSATRIFGTFSHPNVFSLYLFTVTALASIYFLVYARKDNARLFTGLYLLLLLGTLFLTFARIAWIALFVFALLIALWRYRFLLVPLILFPIILTAFVPVVNERVMESINPTADSSIVWRQNLWHDLILKTKLDDRELFGGGMDTFRISAEALRGDRFGSNDAHNDYVKFYVEGGFVGLALFLLYLALYAFPVSQVRRLTPSHSLKNMATLLLLLLLTLAIASLSDNVFKNTPVQWLLAVTTGGFLALYRSSLPRDHQA